MIGTFGRGIYIIDDYTPFREIAKNANSIDKEGTIFPIKDALMFQQSTMTGRNNFGATYYRAENPPYGATFTYHLKENIKTKKDIRKKEEKEVIEKGGTPDYPTFAELREEDLEESPYLLFVIKNENNQVIRKLKAGVKEGISRITWDLRYASDSPLSLKTNINKHSGMPCLPGEYSVEMHKSIDGNITQVTEPIKFTVKLLDNATIPVTDKLALDDFRKKVQQMVGVVTATDKKLKEMQDKIQIIKKTIKTSEGASPDMLETARKIELDLAEIDRVLNGDESISKRAGNQTPSISDRIGYIIFTMWYTNASPTETNVKSFEIASSQLSSLLSQLKTISDQDIKSMNDELDKLDAPWTPGRFPQWKN